MDFARELLEAVPRAPSGPTEIIDRLAAAVGAACRSTSSATPTRASCSRSSSDEHPQTIALVLAHMPPRRPRCVLSGLAPELQADVAHRIAVMDRTSPEIIRQVEAALERKLSSVLQPAELSTVGGLDPLVDIINRADRTTERLILEALEARNPELAEEIRSRMFMFEDIVTLEDRSVQLVLRQVEPADLATALKGVAGRGPRQGHQEPLRARGENLLEEIDLLGPVRLREVEEAQQKIVRGDPGARGRRPDRDAARQR